MKTIFDKATNDAILTRISRLNNNSVAVWGSMTLYQMLKHCTLWEEMILGRQQYKRMFLGRIFGALALRSFLKNEDPMPRNARTVPGFEVTGSGSVEEEKEKWMAMVQQHASIPMADFVHPFFGKMTREQLGYLAYKHTDHHLRQFGV
ncbi:MAG TPA: DUF1569 domain-containing protein [Chitinophagaceae bacterium]|nr:DUF1569 domain-containing protein [Chitinophagaceae bacterium]